jgi:protein involved in polysaccharide export with SLBB domain
MPNPHFRWRGSSRRLVAFCTSLALGLSLFTGPNLAQILSPLQLQQLQQQQPGTFGQVGNAQPSAPESLTLEPASPESRTPLPPSRLEQIMSARAGTTLRQFGYDQLGRGRAVSSPTSVAIQDDYVLGVGDEIVVTLRGQENSEFRAVINNNGQLILPRLNPIAAAGRAFGNFRDDLAAAVRRSYVATNAFISVARIRAISVQITGEVNVPGQRVIPGLASAVDALVLSGGIKKTGSLRNVIIQRGKPAVGQWRPHSSSASRQNCCYQRLGAPAGNLRIAGRRFQHGSAQPVGIGRWPGSARGVSSFGIAHIAEWQHANDAVGQ